jgi:hypothetical protein
MTLEEFLPFAENLLEQKRGELKEARLKLNAANETIKQKSKKLNYYSGLIRDLCLSVTNFIFIIGGMIGACTSKYILDKFGYKYGILFHYLFSLIAELAILIPFSLSKLIFQEYESIGLPSFFLFSRLLYGLQGGISCLL